MSPIDDYFRRYKITNPAYQVARIAGRLIHDRASSHFSGKMLEIGCGTKIKGLLVEKFIEEHIGLDHEDCPHDKSKIDIFGTAYEIPEKDNMYDCVLSTAVLEHLEEPAIALQEAFRVLKPGGTAIYTMPLFWHIHEEPRDFFRYTKFGLQYLFEKVGFEIIEITPMSGFWITFSTEWGYYLQRFRRGLFKYVVDAAILFNNLVFFRLDQGPLKDERFTWMYLVVARKPDQQASPNRPD